MAVGLCALLVWEFCVFFFFFFFFCLVAQASDRDLDAKRARKKYFSHFLLIHF